MMLFFQEMSILLLLWDLASSVHDTQSFSFSIPISVWFGSGDERLLSAAMLGCSLKPGSLTAKSFFPLWPCPSLRGESGRDALFLSGPLIKMDFLKIKYKTQFPPKASTFLSIW